jgi:galactitol-specific phosphotransferase system IIB component
MKKYIKLFLLLFTFTTTHTIAMATEVVDSTLMESKIETSSVDSEENSKDFKLDLFVSSVMVHTTFGKNIHNTSVVGLKNNAYLRSPFKPPRA